MTEVLLVKITTLQVILESRIFLNLSKNIQYESLTITMECDIDRNKFHFLPSVTKLTLKQQIHISFFVPFTPQAL